MMDANHIDTTPENNEDNIPECEVRKGNIVEYRISTSDGKILVAVQGDRSKRAIFTYHDLGLNYVTNFQAFFNYSSMRSILEHFCVYHLNAPGQEEGAPELPYEFICPTMDELADQIDFVMEHFSIISFIGFGVGLGANILTRYAIENPDKVDALILINCCPRQAGWMEWGEQKYNTIHLFYGGMTQQVFHYLLWHHFGTVSEERNHDLQRVYKDNFTRGVNPINLALLIDAYVSRTALDLEVKGSFFKKLKVPVLNMTGAYSAHVDDTVLLNEKLDRSNSTWIKISDSGLILEEQPARVAEAFHLFLQGVLPEFAVKYLRRYIHLDYSGQPSVPF